MLDFLTRIGALFGFRIVREVPSSKLRKIMHAIHQRKKENQ